MLRVGLTGGIGSGKTTVAALFARHGIPVIDTDDIARVLAQPGQPAYEEIVRVFGREILDDEGRIVRPRLGKLVFASPDRRRQLEKILHPHIRVEVAQRLRDLAAPYCIVVVPLLIEAGFTNLVDRILVVDCEESRQIARVAARSGLSEPEIRRIMAAQLDREARLRHADDVLMNDGNLTTLETAVEQLHGRYLRLAVSPG